MIFTCSGYVRDHYKNNAGRKELVEFNNSDGVKLLDETVVFFVVPNPEPSN